MPDWTTPTVDDTVPNLFHQHYIPQSESHQGVNDDTPHPKPANYNACGTLSTSAIISGSSLVVKGLCFDLVQDASLISEDELSVTATPKHLRGKTYPTRESRSDVLEAVCLADVSRAS